MAANLESTKMLCFFPSRPIFFAKTSESHFLFSGALGALVQRSTDALSNLAHSAFDFWPRNKIVQNWPTFGDDAVFG